MFILMCAALFVACQPKDEKTTVSTKSDKPHSVAELKDTAAEKEEVVSADPVIAIRQIVEKINNDKPEPKHTEFMCDEKMKVDRFYKNGELVKISVDFGTIGDVYAREDYYYDKGELIFKYEFVEGGPACQGCIKKNEYRSYVSNGQVIKYLKNQDTAECRTCSFESTAKENKLFKANTPAQIKAVLCR